MAAHLGPRRLLLQAFRAGVARLGGCVAPLALAAAAPAHAEERLPLTLDVKTDIYSAYVWRGRALDKHAVAQPSVIATLDAKEVGSFALKLWSNWDLSQRSADSKATKTGGGINVFNITPSYSKNFGPLGFTVGNIWYTFPGDGYPSNSKSTDELYVTVAYKHALATPSLSVYYDYRGVGQGFLDDNPGKDLYVRAALDKSFALSDRLTAGATALIGGGTCHYNAVRYKSSDEGFADYQVSVQTAYALTDAFSAGVTLAYTGLIGGAWGLDRENLSPDEIFWGGVNLRWRF